jgi:hypothetical protein
MLLNEIIPKIEDLRKTLNAFVGKTGGRLISKVLIDDIQALLTNLLTTVEDGRIGDAINKLVEIRKCVQFDNFEEAVTQTDALIQLLR